MSFHEFLHVLWHGTHDTLKLLPFLFFTYLLMEVLEHKAGDGAKNVIARAGRMGPLIGALLGLIPQCGFSAVAAGLFAARIVTPGTVLAVFLATSDEMLPVLLGAGIPVLRVLAVLGVKFVIAALCGFMTDLVLRRHIEKPHVEAFCDEEHCHCERGVWRSAFHHTWQISLFVLVVNLVLGFVMEFVGTDALASLVGGIPVLGESVTALIGLVPNCAASVAIATLYAKGVISAGAMLAGVLSGAGTALLVLFRTNKHLGQNLLFALALFVLGVLFGSVLEITGFLAVLGL